MIYMNNGFNQIIFYEITNNKRYKTQFIKYS